MKGLMLKASALMIISGMVTVMVPAAARADAIDRISKQACEQIKKSERAISGCNDAGDERKLLDINNPEAGLAQKIVNTMLLIAGIVAVIFIILGGIAYMTSTGDPGRITQAKHTILYAIIGLIITIIAIPVSQFVIKVIQGF